MQSHARPIHDVLVVVAVELPSADPFRAPSEAILDHGFLALTLYVEYELLPRLMRGREALYEVVYLIVDQVVLEGGEQELPRQLLDIH